METTAAQQFFGEVAKLALKVDESDFLKSVPKIAGFGAASYRYNYLEWLYSLQRLFAEILGSCEQSKSRPYSTESLEAIEEFERELNQLKNSLDVLVGQINSESIELDRVIRLFRTGFLANVNLTYGLVVGTYLSGNWPLKEAVKSIRSLIPSYERAGATAEELTQIAIAIDTLDVMYCE